MGSKPPPVAQSIVYHAIKITLGPILLTQGTYLRRTLPDIPEAAGARRGKTGQGKPLRLLIVGDSSAAGVGANTQQEALSGRLIDNLENEFEIQWELIAKTGWTTLDALEHLESIEARSFDVVVSSLGVNDALTGRSPRSYILRQQRFIDLLVEKFSAQYILLSALPPMQCFPSLPQPLSWFLGRAATQFNQALTTFIDQRDNLEFIPILFPMSPDMLATDLFHPGPPVYKIWGHEAASRMRANSELMKLLGA